DQLSVTLRDLEPSLITPCRCFRDLCFRDPDHTGAFRYLHDHTGAFRAASQRSHRCLSETQLPDHTGASETSFTDHTGCSEQLPITPVLQRPASRSHRCFRGSSDHTGASETSFRSHRCFSSPDHTGASETSFPIQPPCFRDQLPDHTGASETSFPITPVLQRATSFPDHTGAFRDRFPITPVLRDQLSRSHRCFRDQLPDHTGASVTSDQTGASRSHWCFRDQLPDHTGASEQLPDHTVLQSSFPISFDLPDHTGASETFPITTGASETFAITPVLQRPSTITPVLQRPSRSHRCFRDLHDHTGASENLSDHTGASETFPITPVLQRPSRSHRCFRDLHDHTGASEQLPDHTGASEQLSRSHRCFRAASDHTGASEQLPDHTGASETFTITPVLQSSFRSHRCFRASDHTGASEQLPDHTVLQSSFPDHTGASASRSHRCFRDLPDHTGASETFPITPVLQRASDHTGASETFRSHRCFRDLHDHTSSLPDHTGASETSFPITPVLQSSFRSHGASEQLPDHTGASEQLPDHTGASETSFPITPVLQSSFPITPVLQRPASRSHGASETSFPITPVLQRPASRSHASETRHRCFRDQLPDHTGASETASRSHRCFRDQLPDHTGASETSFPITPVLSVTFRSDRCFPITLVLQRPAFPITPVLQSFRASRSHRCFRDLPDHTGASETSFPITPVLQRPASRSHRCFRCFRDLHDHTGASETFTITPVLQRPSRSHRCFRDLSFPITPVLQRQLPDHTGASETFTFPITPVLQRRCFRARSHRCFRAAFPDHTGASEQLPDHTGASDLHDHTGASEQLPDHTGASETFPITPVLQSSFPITPVLQSSFPITPVLQSSFPITPVLQRPSRHRDLPDHTGASETFPITPVLQRPSRSDRCFRDLHDQTGASETFTITPVLQRPSRSDRCFRDLHDQTGASETFTIRPVLQRPSRSHRCFRDLHDQTGASEQLPDDTGASEQLPDDTGASEQLPDDTGASEQLPDHTAPEQILDKVESAFAADQLDAEGVQRRIHLCNALVRLSKRLLASIDVDDIFSSLVPGFFQECPELRAALLRCVRKFLVDDVAVHSFLKFRLDICIARCLDLGSLDEEPSAGLLQQSERFQAMKLINALLHRSPRRVTAALVQPLLAICRHAERDERRDRLMRAAVLALAELALLNPPAVAPGLGALLQASLEAPLPPRCTEALVAALASLLNSPDGRQHWGAVRACLDYLTGPLAGSELRADGRRGQQRGGGGGGGGFVGGSGRPALLSLFRSWPGLLASRPPRSLVAMLGVQNSPGAVLDLLHFYFDLFLVRRPPPGLQLGCRQLADAVRTPSPAWDLADGFVAAEGCDLVPPPSGGPELRPAQAHQALLLQQFACLGLLRSLAGLLTADSPALAGGAALLLGELLFRCRLLPPGALGDTDPAACLAPLLDSGAGRQALLLVSAVQTARARPPRASSVYLAHLLGQASCRHGNSRLGVGASCANSRASDLPLVPPDAGAAADCGDGADLSAPLPSLSGAGSPQSAGGWQADPDCWPWPELPGFLRRLAAADSRRLFASVGSGGSSGRLNDAWLGLCRRLCSFYSPSALAARPLDWPHAKDAGLSAPHFGRLLGRLADRCRVLHASAFDLAAACARFFDEAAAKQSVAIELETSCARCALLVAASLPPELLNSTGLSVALDRLLSGPPGPAKLLLASLDYARGDFGRRVLRKAVAPGSSAASGAAASSAGVTAGAGVASGSSAASSGHSAAGTAAGAVGPSASAASMTNVALADAPPSETRQFGVRLLTLLLRLGLAWAWGPDLLLRLLPDPDAAVQAAALAALEETCDHLQQQHWLSSCLLRLPAAAAQIGEQAAPLLARLCGHPAGYRAMSERALLQQQWQLWRCGLCAKYPHTVDTLLAESYASCCRLPTHLLGQLARHSDGVRYLAGQSYVAGLAQRVRDLPGEDAEFWCDRAEVAAAKAALWAVGHVASTELGLLLLEGRSDGDCDNDDGNCVGIGVGAVASMAQLAQACPVLSVRGVCFWALCLVASSQAGGRWASGPRLARPRRHCAGIVFDEEASLSLAAATLRLAAASNLESGTGDDDTFTASSTQSPRPVRPDQLSFPSRRRRRKGRSSSESEDVLTRMLVLPDARRTWTGTSAASLLSRVRQLGANVTVTSASLAAISQQPVFAEEAAAAAAGASSIPPRRAPPPTPAGLALPRDPHALTLHRHCGSAFAAATSAAASASAASASTSASSQKQQRQQRISSSQAPPPPDDSAPTSGYASCVGSRAQLAGPEPGELLLLAAASDAGGSPPGEAAHAEEACVGCRLRQHRSARRWTAQTPPPDADDSTAAAAASPAGTARRDVLRLVGLLTCQVNLAKNEDALVQLRARWPRLFDLCLYSDVSLLLARFPYTRRNRAFVQDLFSDPCCRLRPQPLVQRHWRSRGSGRVHIMIRLVPAHAQRSRVSAASDYRAGAGIDTRPAGAETADSVSQRVDVTAAVRVLQHSLELLVLLRGLSWQMLSRRVGLGWQRVPTVGRRRRLERLSLHGGSGGEQPLQPVVAGALVRSHQPVDEQPLQRDRRPQQSQVAALAALGEQQQFALANFPPLLSIVRHRSCQVQPVAVKKAGRLIAKRFAPLLHFSVLQPICDAADLLLVGLELVVLGVTDLQAVVGAGLKDFAESDKAGRQLARPDALAGAPGGQQGRAQVLDPQAPVSQVNQAQTGEQPVRVHLRQQAAAALQMLDHGDLKNGSEAPSASALRLSSSSGLPSHPAFLHRFSTPDENSGFAPVEAHGVQLQVLVLNRPWQAVGLELPQLLRQLVAAVLKVK
uniref:C2H2-type domain-containing protein n=1 Tax=Macrostomum lignano TaxID=282301 RepID=A0A1I8IMM6_9PLAT